MGWPGGDKIKGGGPEIWCYAEIHTSILMLYLNPAIFMLTHCNHYKIRYPKIIDYDPEKPSD
jgi:hypothetical protein